MADLSRFTSTIASLRIKKGWENLQGALKNLIMEWENSQGCSKIHQGWLVMAKLFKALLNKQHP